jgi:hypothetical protein
MNIFFILLIFILLLLFIYILKKYILQNNNVQFSDINDNCLYTRFGCCKDKLTPKLDIFGSNCRGF